LLLFKNILSGKNDLNTKAATKQASRHGIGYQKYVTRQVKGEWKYKKNERLVRKPEKA
jgi:predicted DNA binding CopG/RHH family protein